MNATEADARPHKWVRSNLGHGEQMCEYCKGTNRELAVLGMLNHCDKAPATEAEVDTKALDPKALETAHAAARAAYESWDEAMTKVGFTIPAIVPVAEAAIRAYLFALPEVAATECACCGETKPCPLRRDDMGGYVCLTCIDARLSTLQVQTSEAVAWPKRRINVPHGDKSADRIVGFIISPGDEAYGTHGLSEPLAWLDRMCERPASQADLREALTEAGSICEQYAAFIRDHVKADDLEMHPYLPRVEEAAAKARSLSSERREGP